MATAKIIKKFPDGKIETEEVKLPSKKSPVKRKTSTKKKGDTNDKNSDKEKAK